MLGEKKFQILKDIINIIKKLCLVIKAKFLMSSTSDHDQNRSLLVQKLEFDSIREETERDLKPRRRFSDLKPLKMFKQRSDRSLLNKRHSNAI